MRNESIKTILTIITATFAHSVAFILTTIDIDEISPGNGTFGSCFLLFASGTVGLELLMGLLDLDCCNCFVLRFGLDFNNGLEDISMLMEGSLFDVLVDVLLLISISGNMSLEIPRW